MYRYLEKIVNLLYLFSKIIKKNYYQKKLYSIQKIKNKK